MDLHARMLAEMGIGTIWRLRQSGDDALQPPEEAVAPAFQAEDLPVSAPDLSPVAAEPVLTPRPRIEMPLSEPQSRPLSPPVTQPVMPAADSLVAGMDWEPLEQAVRDCSNCVLCKRRKQVVFGVGDIQADWMFVGEGPGAEEDARGEPFVGQAGKLLDAMLDSIGLQRGKNVYITNAVKCRPPGNRTPEATEIAACQPYLVRQIELVRPKLLIALGRPAAQTLLQREVRIGQARGHLYSYMDIPVIVTYHPAYLLRNQEDKAKAWEDLCFMRKQAEQW